MTQSLTFLEIDVPSFAAQSPEDVQTFRFAVATDYLPAGIDAIPSIDSVSFTPARISLGKDLGQRASLKISFRDHKHVFNGEPYDQGTFWGKWRGRYGTRLRGREVRLIRGVVGQSLEQMDTRYYVVDATDGPTPGASYTLEAKDILKLADQDRAQAPVLSNGRLAGSITALSTSVVLSPVGIGDLEYPASGWVCIGGKEVVAFTRIGNDLTITRAGFGTVAQEHSSGDRVQLVLRYTGNDVADIIQDLLVNYAGVPASYITLAEWQAETAAYLNVIYAATITEPTSVKDLLSELIEQAALALWWDDRARMVRLNVLREISTDADSFDQDRIIEGSLSVKDQPAKRISQIWTFYGQRDPTDTGASEDNYRSALADVDLLLQDAYGSAEIRKIQARWVETIAAATRLNSIQLSRFRNPPRVFVFDLFRDVTVVPAGGYQLRWWANQDEFGNEVPALLQVTQVTRHPDRIHVEAEEMLASGQIVLVNVVFLNPTTGVQEWEVPATWNDDDNSVSVFGPGGGGYRNTSENGGRGGGGGAFSRSENLPLSGSPAALIQYNVGAGGVSAVDGDDSWFDGATFETATVAAEHGQSGTGRTSGGIGGQAANGAGDFRRSGGNGASGGKEEGKRAGGGGGGGAGGPNGDGGDGGGVGGNERGGGGGGGGGADGGEDVTEIAQGGTGVNGGGNRFGFGGGDAATPAGSEGGGGRGGGGLGTNDGYPGGDGEQIWTQTVAPIRSAGPGGGGGGGAASYGPGGPGGLYGGGGGGSAGDGSSGGRGGDGLIVITWREAEET